MTNRHLEKVLAARRARLPRQQERLRAGNLELMRRAANGLGHWKGACRRRACRRARRCTGKPVEEGPGALYLTPPCITPETSGPARLWVQAHYGPGRRAGKSPEGRR